MTTITQELINQGKSARGGWSRAQLLLLGISWPPKNGWRKEVQGLQITLDAAAKFVGMKNTHIKFNQSQTEHKQPIRTESSKSIRGTNYIETERSCLPWDGCDKCRMKNHA